MSALLILACSGGKRRVDSAETASGRLREAIKSGDAAQVFFAMDLESQWSVETIYRCEREMWRVIRSDFPADIREREATRYAAAGRAKDPQEYFASMGLHSRFRGQLTLVRQVIKKDAGGVMIETESGERLPFGKGADGAWGYSGFAEELQRRKDHASQALRIVQQNADLYRSGRP